MHKFSIKEVIIFGWEMFKNHIILLLAVMVIPYLITNIPVNFLNLIDPNIIENNLIVSVILLILFILVLSYISYAFSMGSTLIALQIVEKKQAELRMLFSFFKKPMWILQFFLATLLMAFVVFLIPFVVFSVGIFNENLAVIGIGFLLFLIFAITVGIRLQFFSYFIVEKNKNCIDSLKASWNISKGSVIRLILYVLTAILLSIGVVALIALVFLGIGFGVFQFNNIIGVVSIVIGVAAYIVAIFALSNVFFLAHAHIYRKLLTATYK